MASDPTVAVLDPGVVARMADGDERALAELYDRMAGAVYSLAHAVLRDDADAEEVAAETFAQAWRLAGRYEAGRGSVAAWLLTMARTRALDRLRARRRRDAATQRAAALDAGGLALPVGGPGPAPDRAPEHAETRALVVRALDALPEAQRRALHLAYFGGLSHREIAAALGEPLGTVKTRIRLGLERLRAARRGGRRTAPRRESGIVPLHAPRTRTGRRACRATRSGASPTSRRGAGAPSGSGRSASPSRP